jgi:hypothetical protein
MILSKQALQAVMIAGKDKQIPGLDNLHVTATGECVAANRNCVVTVSPVSEKVCEALPIQNSGACPESTFSTETVKHLLSAIPADTMFKGRLEFLDMKEVSEHELQFLLHDGKRKKTIEARKYNGKYIPYTEIVNRVLSKRQGAVKCLLNRQRLRLLLDVMDKVCEDVSSGEAPAFIEFCEGGEIIIRGVNQKTGQRALAVMTAYQSEQWLEPDEWENNLSGKIAVKKVARRVK